MCFSLTIYYGIRIRANVLSKQCRKIILSLTREYFKGQESIGERSTIIVTAFLYLVVVMMILIIDESKLETGLDAAYSNFTAGANLFLKTQGFPSQ